MKKYIFKKPLPFTSVLQDITDIETRNEAFDDLDSIDQRREIALDSLNLIMDGVVNASNGKYWEGSLSKIKSDRNQTAEDFQRALLEVKTCKVCARGAIMLSQIRLSNEISPTDVNAECGNETIIKGFEMDTLLAMENEYEYCTFHTPYKWNTIDKLANILLNVIVNGDYDESFKTDYVDEYLQQLN